MGKELQEFKEQVALANRLLHHYGLTTYLGHASARIPDTDRIIIKARPHVSMDRVRAQHLMTIDLDGNILEASDEYPSRVSEWVLHAEIYKARPEVGAVVHTHQKWCTILGIAGVPVLPVQHPTGLAVGTEPWPVYEESYAIVTEVKQARVVAQTLGKHMACHLRTHGIVVVGANMEQALMAAAQAEHEAEMTWHAMLVGDPETIPMMAMGGTLDDDVGDRQDEVSKEDWQNHLWVDEHLHAVRNRGVQF